MFSVARINAVGGQDDLPVSLIGINSRHPDTGVRVDPCQNKPVGPEIGERLTGEVRRFEVAEQMELVMSQMRKCLEAAGSNLSRVIQCSVYANDPAHFQIINDVYRRFFPTDPPARKLIFVSGWHGPFDVEVDCIAAA